MGKFIAEIQRFERERIELISAIKKAVAVRRESPAKWDEWELAAKRYHEHKSPISHLFALSFRGSSEAPSAELRMFMFDYIAVDPNFHRSGYIMERILRKVKRLKLSEQEQSLLEALLLNRIRNRGLRNFRDVCQAAQKIKSQRLQTIVEELSRSADDQVRARANFALPYLAC